MTEEEWLNCNEPKEMLQFLINKVSCRKLRLLACAYYRQRTELMSSQTTNETLGTIEAWADDEVSTEAVLQHLEQVRLDALQYDEWHRPFHMLILLEAFNQYSLMSHIILELLLPGAMADQSFSQLANKIRCIFGNPIPQLNGCTNAPTKASLLIKLAQGMATGLLKFMSSSPFNTATPALNHSVISYSADPAWLSSTVLALARGIYEERAFDQMPILADALQDAGCDDSAVLDHCRDPRGIHTRGCWVLDLVLSKS